MTEKQLKLMDMLLKQHEINAKEFMLPYLIKQKFIENESQYDDFVNALDMMKKLENV